MATLSFDQESSKNFSYSSSEELYAIVNSYISRKTAEELDLVEKRGGNV